MIKDFYINWVVNILLPDGKIISTRKLAVTSYHAIDKALREFHRIQPDRSKYKAIAPFIEV